MKVNVSELQLEKETKDRLVKSLFKIFEKLEVPGILKGLLGSYINNEISFEELTDELENLAFEKNKFKDLIPVFNENLEVEHAVDREYGLLANYKPLFDEHQNLVGFVPSWVYLKE
jgi:hypothetical protein